MQAADMALRDHAPCLRAVLNQSAADCALQTGAQILCLSSTGLQGSVFQPSFRKLQAPCACSCGTKTKRLSAIASQPFCKWPRHEHRSVLISQAGRMDVVKILSLSLSSWLIMMRLSCSTHLQPMQNLQADPSASANVEIQNMPAVSSRFCNNEPLCGERASSTLLTAISWDCQLSLLAIWGSCQKSFRKHARSKDMPCFRQTVIVS